MAEDVIDVEFREGLFHSLFKRFSVARQGYTELRDLKALLGILAPERDVNQAAGVLPWLAGPDTDVVDEAEFVCAVRSLTTLLTDSTLASRAQQAEGLTGNSGEEAGSSAHEGGMSSSVSVGDWVSSAVDEEAAAADGGAHMEYDAGAEGPVTVQYEHPAGCRPYLETEVVPLLRQGLLELLAAHQDSRVREASGRDWDTQLETMEVDRQVQTRSVQYLPRTWRPFSALRWLGEWLHAHNPKPPCDSDYGRSYGDYTPQEKAALIFTALDAAQAGFVDSAAMVDTAQHLLSDRPAADIEAILQSLGAPTTSGVNVDLQLFAITVAGVAEVAGQQRLDAAVLHALGASSLLPHCARRSDKFGAVFLVLDRMCTGVVHGDDVAAIVRRVDGTKVDAALSAAGADAASQLSREDFVSAMQAVFYDVHDEAAVDAAVLELLERPMVVMSVPGSPRNPLEDVEPPSLADFVRALPTWSAHDAVAAGDVLDRVAAQASGSSAVAVVRNNLMVLVDVRGPDEVAVSTIPGAFLVPAKEDPKAEHGWSISGDLRAVNDRVIAALAPPEPGAPSTRPSSAMRASTTGGGTQSISSVTVVVYCSTGERSGAVAAQVARALPQQPNISVKTLCGGMLAYYNNGGSVHDAQGQVVQSVHPGKPAFKAYITRPSKFKL